ncbi:MAG: hypothetical protein ACK5JC_02985 [Bacteroidota bacterium]|jgi:hypothetical protein
MKPYTLKFLLSSGIIAVIHSLWLSFLLPRFSVHFSFAHLQVTNAGVWLITVAVFAYICRATQKKASGFITSFMLTSACKLFGYLIVMLVYGFTHKSYAVTYAMVFLIFYFSYSAWEIRALVKFFDAMKTELPINKNK